MLHLELELKGIKLEIFRNAYVELRVPINNNFCRHNFRHEDVDKPVMYPYPLCEYLVSFLYFADKLYAQNGVLEPCVIQLSLYNIRGITLSENLNFDEIFCPQFLTETHLELPAMQFPTPLESEKIAQILANRVWNAFGFDAAPLFGNGRFSANTE